MISPVYESTESLYVINTASGSSYAAGGYDSVMVDQQLLKDYRELIKSNFIISLVLDTLSINDVTREDLRDRVSVELKSETRILEIKVQDTNPSREKVLAETFGEVLINQSRSWMKIENVCIIDNAEIPDKPVKPAFL
jgi:capsular polysaccharide biosynthesis protein